MHALPYNPNRRNARFSAGGKRHDNAATHAHAVQTAQQPDHEDGHKGGNTHQMIFE
jgi:hypothetical protein